MSTMVWALTFTILGVTPEHGYLPKFATRQDCEETLTIMKQEYRTQKKQMVGACVLVSRTK